MNKDTISLLRECHAGAKMGIKSIADVLDDVCNEHMRSILEDGKREHERIQKETKKILCNQEVESKEPDLMASAMSWVKTNAKMAMDGSDQTIANLITDGCNMGITSLNRYLNQYEQADHQARTFAKELIRAEEKMGKELRSYL